MNKPIAQLSGMKQEDGTEMKKLGCLNYVISGAGRSGTTFLAHCFLEAGFDLGGGTPASIGDKYRPAGGGLEHCLFTMINDQVHHLIQEGKSFKSIAEELSEMMNFSWPQVVKDPRFTATIEAWGEAGFLPKHLFFCIRDPEQTIKSMENAFTWFKEGQRYDFFWQYNLLSYCLKKDIPITFVLFPRIGRDREYANRILGQFIKKEEPWNVVQRVWDEKMVHY